MAYAPPRIEILPEHLIDQIKAGEVIERPGNLIKEILENAVDAGATKLELTLKNNGLDLISLKDNGHGMHFNDLPLAFSRHATSKISRFEDLYHLRSFGFRGEALASIASISKLQCISKTTSDQTSSELRIEGGETIFHGQRQTASDFHGTELVIQDLFFNTPARLKFIQSQQSEKNFIKKIIFAFILSHPEIEFQIKTDEADKEIYPIQENHLDRIKDLFPKAQSSIIHSQRFYENNELDLFLVPAAFKAPLKLQNIYINNRYILDKQLHRVMTNAFESLGGEDYHYVAYFNVPPDTIDVNVHPNKTIIKCLEISKMISLLTSTIKEIGQKSRPNFSESNHQHQGPLLSTFLEGLAGSPSLQQERHDYNMEGVFSPHGGPKVSDDQFIWVGSTFLKRSDNFWLAVSAVKLLECFTKSKLKTSSSSIPLLVSEPFSAKGVKEETMKELSASGAELEFLGKETIVLRSIPLWMNGFPLKEVILCLLHEKSFSDIGIDPTDWSQSTWNEMLQYFTIEELFQRKIALDLSSLLKEKLR